VDRGDAAERPPTTRIGPAGGSGRGLRTAVVLVAFALAVAVVKPWDWIAAPSVAPGREGAAILVASPTTAPSASPPSAPPAAPRDWTDVGALVACLSGTSWLAVVDQVDGPTVSRSWTRLDLVPATDPLDPAIARTHVYAGAVPRIGFCAPGPAAGGGEAADAHGAAGARGGAPFVIRAWRLTPVESATQGTGTALPGTREAVPIVPPVVSGGTIAEGGALFGPPAGVAAGSMAGRTPDPEGAWAAGGLAQGPAHWAADDGRAAQASWRPGTYVFRVGPSGAGPVGGDPSGGDPVGGGPSGGEVAWFAIELRGPWVGPGAPPAP